MLVDGRVLSDENDLLNAVCQAYQGALWEGFRFNKAIRQSDLEDFALVRTKASWLPHGPHLITGSKRPFDLREKELPVYFKVVLMNADADAI